MGNSDHQKSGLVSVIMPTFNRAHFILDAVTSIFRQSHRPVQLVIVDDGSTDGTDELLKKWREEHSYDREFRLDVVRQEQRGACVARNTGILRSEGEFLVFMDSDDILYPHAFEWAVESLADPELEYVYFRVHRSDQDLVPVAGEYVGCAPTRTSADICLYLWHTMGAIYRRSIVERTGFWNPELSGSQDWEFAARIKLTGAKFAYDRRVIGLFRDHPYGRIGVKKFKHDYVRSVELACDSIRKSTEEAGLLDMTVRRQLARRLFVHGIEFGAHGYFEDKNRLLAKAHELAGDGDPGFNVPLLAFQKINSRAVARASLFLHRARSSVKALKKDNRPGFPAVRQHLPVEVVPAREGA